MYVAYVCMFVSVTVVLLSSCWSNLVANCMHSLAGDVYMSSGCQRTREKPQSAIFKTSVEYRTNEQQSSFLAIAQTA